MPSLVRQALLMPFWAAQVLTQEKFFARNPIIGNRWLNEHGLHTWRTSVAHRLAAARRRRLARLVDARDLAAFERDGFIVRRNFLPSDVFAALTAQVRELRAPAREMVEGDTVTRLIAVDRTVLSKVPAARRLLGDPDYRNLIRYVGASAAAPMIYIQSVLSHAVEGAPDPQLDLHTDTFHPTVKAWLFLTDTPEDAMPFVYVPGSHRLTPARVAWEKQMSIAASLEPLEHTKRPGRKLPAVISPEQLSGLGLPPPQSIAVPANTLVVADTFGFHSRGASAKPTCRVEIWAMGRRNPFLPWNGLDPWSIPGLGSCKPSFYWRSVDVLEGLGLARQRWRPRPATSAFDPA